MARLDPTSPEYTEIYNEWLASQILTTNAVPFSTYLENYQQSKALAHKPLTTPLPLVPVGTGLRDVIIDVCDYGHRFPRLPDHPTKQGKALCPYCMAASLKAIAERC